MEELQKKKVGRPPCNINNFLPSQLETLASLNLTDKQICQVLEISESSLNLYKKDEIIFKALKKGKEISDARVERSLFERAMGYSHPEDNIHVTKNGEVIITPTIKYYPPDTVACIFWLKNRKPDEWRDKTEMKHDLTENLMAAVVAALAGSKDE